MYCDSSMRLSKFPYFKENTRCVCFEKVKREVNKLQKSLLRQQRKSRFNYKGFTFQFVKKMRKM